MLNYSNSPLFTSSSQVLAVDPLSLVDPPVIRAKVIGISGLVGGQSDLGNLPPLLIKSGGKFQTGNVGVPEVSGVPEV